jgi:sugar transferase (PEP-CTERM/EpsH1 system associated)
LTEQKPMPGSSRRSVLFLAHRVPYPPDKGDRIRSFHLLRFLAQRADVHLACLADEPLEPDTLSTLARYCRRVEVVPIGRAARLARGLLSFACGRTVSEGAFHAPALHRLLRRWAQDSPFDAALASASSLIPYLRRPWLRPVPAVVDLVDVDSQKWLDYAAASRPPRAWLFRVEGRRLRELERQAAGWAQALTLAAEAEAELYRRCCGTGPVHAVTNGVDLDYFRPQPGEEPDRCVFVGALDYRPNVAGAVWFCREVWPEVLRHRPGARVALVGRRPAVEVRRLEALPGVEVVGQVPDVRPYLARATVAVVPLAIARGVQNKVLESLAMGKATVASPAPLAGLRAEPGRHLLCADSADEWVEAILRLFTDPALRQRLGSAGRRYTEEHHCWERCLEPFADLLGLGERRSRPDEIGLAALPAGGRK